jgi:hypothetical protein
MTGVVDSVAGLAAEASDFMTFEATLGCEILKKNEIITSGKLIK